MTRSRRNPLQRMNYVLLLALSGCGTQQSTPASPCAWGSEVKIPEVDSTRPTWAIDSTCQTTPPLVTQAQVERKYLCPWMAQSLWLAL